MNDVAKSIAMKSGEPLGSTLLPTAGVCGVSIALLAYAAFGPKLWATQRTDDAAIAIEIVAAGQVLLAAIAWPLWTRNVSTSIAVIGGSIVWLLLAAQIAQRPNGEVIAIGCKLVGVLFLLAAVRWRMPSRFVGAIWGIVAVLVLGAPALMYLAKDY